MLRIYGMLNLCRHKEEEIIICGPKIIMWINTCSWKYIYILMLGLNIKPNYLIQPQCMVQGWMFYTSLVINFIIIISKDNYISIIVENKSTLNLVIVVI